MLTIHARELGLWLTSPVLLVLHRKSSSGRTSVRVWQCLSAPREKRQHNQDTHRMRVANLDVRTCRLDSDRKALQLDQISDMASNPVHGVARGVAAMADI